VPAITPLDMPALLAVAPLKVSVGRSAWAAPNARTRVQPSKRGIAEWVMGESSSG
jgi:hypothetical protein